MKSCFAIIVVATAGLAAFLHSASILSSTEDYDAGEISGWQSYCAAPPSPRYIPRSGSSRHRITRIEIPTEHSHSMFSFASEETVRIRDLVARTEWAVRDGRAEPIEPSRCLDFIHNGTTYYLSDAVILACKETCERVEIAAGTWVYTYAAAGDAVVALTNYGDALLFKGGVWCRMERSSGDVFQCPARGEEAMVTVPRAIQFYSSATHAGITYVGEWPTGRIYLFDGSTLRPSERQPPFVSQSRSGYEAQSLVSYCGDLYVGYWPTGEVWRRTPYGWRKVTRLFSHPAETSGIAPYVDRQSPDLPGTFFGQRVTSLVPIGDRLIASTSNLRGWGREYRPDFLNEDQISEYGAVYQIRRIGCRRG